MNYISKELNVLILAPVNAMAAAEIRKQTYDVIHYLLQDELDFGMLETDGDGKCTSLISEHSSHSMRSYV